MVEATGKVQSMLQVHVFSVGIAKVSGELTESEEMAPQVSRTESYPSHISALSATLLSMILVWSQWWAWDAVPFEKMWVDDEHWLPTVLAGGDVVGDFTFADQMTIVHKDVRRLPAGGYKEAEAMETKRDDLACS